MKTINDIITATNPNPEVFNKLIARHVAIINKGGEIRETISQSNTAKEAIPPALTSDPIAIIAIHIATGERSTYCSIREAARVLGLSSSTVGKCLRGVKYHKQSKGYRFEYAND